MRLPEHFAAYHHYSCVLIELKFGPMFHLMFMSSFVTYLFDNRIFTFVLHILRNVK